MMNCNLIYELAFLCVHELRYKRRRCFEGRSEFTILSIYIQSNVALQHTNTEESNQICVCQSRAFTSNIYIRLS